MWKRLKMYLQILFDRKNDLSFKEKIGLIKAIKQARKGGFIKIE